MNPIIEFWRGIAALMVLVCHYYPHYIGGNIRVANFLWTGVDFFFVISGFIFSKYFFEAELRPKVYGIKRFFRIYPLYLLSLFMYYAVTHAHPSKPLFFIKHLFFLNTTTSFQEAFFFNPAYWTLPVEVEFYMILPLLAFFAKRSSRFLGVVFLLFLVVKLLLNIHVFDGVHLTFANIANVHLPGLLTEFLVGAFMYQLYRRYDPGQAVKAGIWMGGVIVVAICGSLFVKLGNEGIDAHILLRSYFTFFCAVGYAMLIYPLLRVRMNGVFHRFCLIMGSISYGTYLFHNFMPKALDGTVLDNFAGAAACTLLLSYTLYHLYENPIRRYGKRLARSV